MGGPTLLSLTVALVVLSGMFWAVERFRPEARRTRRSRQDSAVDVGYWFFTPLVTRGVTRQALAALFLVRSFRFSRSTRCSCMRTSTYMPAGREPRAFGVAGEPVPAGFVAQLLYPWRRE